MKALLAAAFTTFTLAAFAQQNVFEPIGFSAWPNIQPDTLSEFTKRQAVYDSLHNISNMQEDFDPEQLPTELLDIYNDEMVFEADGGPYYTGPIGCSWYCAPEWDTTYNSSALKSNGAITYGADNAFDFNVSTAWVEGANGSGIGETFSLSIRAGNTHQLASVEIYNGYCKDVTTWQNNNRVKELEMYVNGKSIGILHLANSYLGQRFNIGSYYSANDKFLIEFKIRSVYKGNKYDDTAISDILFDGKYSH